MTVPQLISEYQRYNTNKSGVRVVNDENPSVIGGLGNFRSYPHFPPVVEPPDGGETVFPMLGGMGRVVGANGDVTGVGAMGTGIFVAVGTLPGGVAVVPGGVPGGVIGAGVSEEGCCWDGSLVSPTAPAPLGTTGFVAGVEGGVDKSLGGLLPPFTSPVGVEGP